MPTYTTQEKLEASERLHGILPPGSEVRTILRHCSASGMTRWIDLYAVKDGEIVPLSYSAAVLMGDSLRTRGHEGIEVGGCGMDMGFSLVYSLSRTMFRSGFECIGDRCPSNDHSNGDRDYTPGHCVHSDGGYALRHRWL